MNCAANGSGGTFCLCDKQWGNTCPGLQCGQIPDGCGGVINCGGCSAGKQCEDGGCVCDQQPSNTCTGLVCGQVPDSCGGVIDCGLCSGTDNFCFSNTCRTCQRQPTEDAQCVSYPGLPFAWTCPVASSVQTSTCAPFPGGGGWYCCSTG